MKRNHDSEYTKKGLKMREEHKFILTERFDQSELEKLDIDIANFMSDFWDTVYTSIKVNDMLEKEYRKCKSNALGSVIQEEYDYHIREARNILNLCNEHMVELLKRSKKKFDRILHIEEAVKIVKEAKQKETEE